MRASIAAQLASNCLCLKAANSGFSAPLNSGTNSDLKPEWLGLASMAAAFLETLLRFDGRAVCSVVSSSWPKMNAT